MKKPVRAKTTRKAANKNHSKTDQVLHLLGKPKGASIPDLMKATGWQAHSIRGFMSGNLKRKGHVIESEKTGDVRRYRIGARQVAS